MGFIFHPSLVIGKLQEIILKKVNTSLSKTFSTLCWLIPAGGNVLTDVIRIRRTGCNLHTAANI